MTSQNALKSILCDFSLRERWISNVTILEMVTLHFGHLDVFSGIQKDTITRLMTKMLKFSNVIEVDTVNYKIEVNKRYVYHQRVIFYYITKIGRLNEKTDVVAKFTKGFDHIIRPSPVVL